MKILVGSAHGTASQMQVSPQAAIAVIAIAFTETCDVSCTILTVLRCVACSLLVAKQDSTSMSFRLQPRIHRMQQFGSHHYTFSRAQHGTQHCTAQHSTAQHSAAQHTWTIRVLLSTLPAAIVGESSMKPHLSAGTSANSSPVSNTLVSEDAG